MELDLCSLVYVCSSSYLAPTTVSEELGATLHGNYISLLIYTETRTRFRSAVDSLRKLRHSICFVKLEFQALCYTMRLLSTVVKQLDPNIICIQSYPQRRWPLTHSVRQRERESGVENVETSVGI